MSYDKALDQLCPHMVTWEGPLSVSFDGRIRPLRPISSANSVVLRLNGELVVPSEGYNIPASVAGAKRGPFSFTSANNTLSLIVDQGPQQTVALPEARFMAPLQVAGRLNAGFTGVTFSVDGDKLKIATQSTGPGSSVFVSSTSTAASVFGIVPNREYRGQQLAPGWTLVNDPNTLTDRPTRLIVFDYPLKSSSDYAEISYSTVKEECRRCGGVGIENDWSYDTAGEVVKVRDEDLLVQEIQKICFTSKGSNPFLDWYGTGIVDAIGKKMAAGGFVQNMIVSDVTQAFKRWQSIKSAQETTIGQTVTDREFPFRLLSVNLEQNPSDPTVVFVSIQIQNRSDQPIQLTRGLKLPASLQLVSGRSSR